MLDAKAKVRMSLHREALLMGRWGRTEMVLGRWGKSKLVDVSDEGDGRGEGAIMSGYDTTFPLIEKDAPIVIASARDMHSIFKHVRFQRFRVFSHFPL